MCFFSESIKCKFSNLNFVKEFQNWLELAGFRFTVKSYTKNGQGWELSAADAHGLGGFLRGGGALIYLWRAETHTKLGAHRRGHYQDTIRTLWNTTTV